MAFQTGASYLEQDGLIQHLNRAMEALWLSAAFLVPLMMAPPDSMVFHIQLAKVAVLQTLASAIVILWLVEWLISRNGITSSNWRDEIVGNLTSRPSRWILLSASAFMAVYVISSLLSASSGISIWGGSLVVEGYSLYNMLAYFAIFLVAATHIKTTQQITRLMVAFVGAGVLSASLGILERLEWIPLGTAFTTRVRLESTFGNAIFFGTFLMTTILFTIGIFISNRHWLEKRQSYAILFVLLAIQLVALMLTLSRGPWVSLTTALIAFFAVGLFAVERKILLRIGLVLITSVVFALLVVKALPPRPDIAEETAITDVEGRVYSIYPALTTGGLTNRIETWKASSNLIMERPWFPGQELTLSGLRSLIGYGPEMYRYAYPLVATPESNLQMFAHNFLIHELVEVGLLGGIAFALLLSAALASSSGTLLKDRGVFSSQSAILLTLLAVMIAWVVEQFVGIPRAGDLTVFWLTLAMIVSIAVQREKEHRVLNYSPTSSEEETSFAFNPRLLKLPVAALAIAVVGWVAIEQNVNTVRADMLVGQAMASENLLESISLMDRAIEIEPDEFLYYDRRADIMARHINDVADLQYQAALTQRIYDNRVWAVQKDPLIGEAKVKLADTALDMAGYGDQEKAVEALRIYAELRASTPKYTSFHDYLHSSEAIAYIYLGQPEKGIAVLNDMLSHEPDDNVKARGLYVRGIAYSQIGDSSLAINSVEQSLELESSPAQLARAHGLLTKLYNDTGNVNLSNYHAAKQTELMLIAEEITNQ